MFVALRGPRSLLSGLLAAALVIAAYALAPVAPAKDAIDEIIDLCVATTTGAARR